MSDEPHSIIIGWPLDDIGQVICDHLGIDYDKNWRNSDSKSTWHIELKKWNNNRLDLYISYGLEDDYSFPGAEGRYLIGVHFNFDPIGLVNAGNQLQEFLDFEKKEGLDLPAQEIFIYSDEAAFGFVGDGNGDDYVFERS